MKPLRRNTRLLSLSAIFLSCSGLTLESALGTTLYWDTNGTAAGSGAATGTWDTSTANWTTDLTGVAAPVALTTSILDNLFFSAGTNGTTGTVTVSGTRSANSITFDDPVAVTISGGTGITLGGTTGAGIFQTGAGTVTNTISSALTLNGAQAWTNGTSGSTLAISGTVTRNTGASVNFTPTGAINLTGSGLANTNGILGGWATVGNGGGSGATADWAALDGSGNIVTYTGYTDVASGNQTGAGASAQNWRTVNTGAQTNLTASATINSLVVRSDFSVSSGATMTLGSGGLILSGISRWVKNNGNGDTAGSGQITSGLSSGELFVDVASSTSDASNWRIWTKIVDNGGTAVSLVKTGPGDLGLFNSNNYTGGTYLNSGTLSIASSGSVGAGTLRMNGGALNIRYAGANVDLANDIVISGSNNNISLGVARNLGLNGTISGSGQLTFGNSNHNSSIYLSGANTMTSGTITLVNNTNSVRFSNANAGNANVSWVFNNTTANRNTLDFASGTISFGSMTGNGIVQSNGAGTKTISAGALGLNDTFSGVIANGSGTLALTKVGSGTITLSGANSYTGATTISGGTLALGSTGSINNTSGVSLGTAGTFDVSAKGGYTVNNLTGSGNVTGALTVSTQLAIGNSPGTVNFSSSLTLGSASTYIYELTGGSSTADLGDVAGALTISAGAILDLVQLGTYTGNNKFTLFAYDGALSGTFTGLADGATFTDAGGIWMIDYNDSTAGLNGGVSGSNTYVTVTAVPEPAAALIGGLGILALFRRRR